MNLFLILVSVSGVWLSILGSHTRDSPVDTSDIYWDTVQTCFGGTDLQEHKIQNHSTGIPDLLQRRFFFKCWHFFFFFGKDLYLSQDLIYIIFLQVSQLSDLFRKDVVGSTIPLSESPWKDICMHTISLYNSGRPPKKMQES